MSKKPVASGADIGPQIGRLSMRVEGNNWNAYYAKNETMEGAFFLGSISMAAIRTHPERKNQFMQFMREVVADVVEEAIGVRPVGDKPHPAPEHERSGNA